MKNRKSKQPIEENYVKPFVETFKTLFDKVSELSDPEFAEHFEKFDYSISSTISPDWNSGQLKLTTKWHDFETDEFKKESRLVDFNIINLSKFDRKTKSNKNVLLFRGVLRTEFGHMLKNVTIHGENPISLALELMKTIVNDSEFDMGSAFYAYHLKAINKNFTPRFWNLREVIIYKMKIVLEDLEQ